MGTLYGGTILRIDLTKGTVKREPTAPYAREMLGGRGISAAIVYDAVGPDVGALDPGNVISISAGPLCGVAVTGGRTDIVAKSPETKNLGSSNFGGRFSPELKYAGYDNIIIQGKSEKPVYIAVNNDHVEIRDATDIWGKDTYETSIMIRKDLGDPDVEILSIGPAAEKLIPFSCLRHGVGNAGGRGGMGTVLGSKNLKAIAVRGTNGIKPADLDKFTALNMEIWEKLKKMPIAQEYSQYGTTRILDSCGPIGSVSSFANFQHYYEPPRTGDETSFGILKKYIVNRAGCFYCPIRCMEMCTIPGIGSGVISCENYVAPLLMDIRDYHLVWEVALLCQKYGLDVVSFSNIMGWCMELFERGIITEKDTDGIPLIWGKRESIIPILHKVAKREGFGDLLAMGLKEAAKAIGRGSEDYAVMIKGSPIAPDGSARLRGFQLGIAVSSRQDFTRSTTADYMWEFVNYFFQG